MVKPEIVQTKVNHTKLNCLVTGEDVLEPNLPPSRVF